MTPLQDKLRAALRETADEIPAQVPPLHLSPQPRTSHNGHNGHNGHGARWRAWAAPLAAAALVVAAIAPDRSGADRSLLGLELDLTVSRARLTAALGSAELRPGQIILRRDPGTPAAHALVEVEGYVADDDPRLARLGSVLRPPVVLGAHAVAIGTGT